MSVRERILAIRLMEKLQSRPDFAKALGVEVCGEIAPAGATDKKEKRKMVWDLALSILAFQVSVPASISWAFLYPSYLW